MSNRHVIGTALVVLAGFWFVLVALTPLAVAFSHILQVGSMK